MKKVVRLLLAMASLTALAQEPEKVDLFKGGTDGFELFRIPGMVVTTKGTVLTYCEARHDARSDWGEIEVHLRRSTDGGKTWDTARKIAHAGERVEGNPRKKAGGEHEQTVNNPVAVVDRNGAIHFLYQLNYARCFSMRSEDDGLTWTKPVEITSAFEGFRSKCDWKVIATGPGHGIQMRSGRLVVPVWLAYGKVGEHAPSMAGMIVSDDHGQTWTAGDIAVPNAGDFRNPNETSAAELRDGRVMLVTRNVSKPNRKLVTVSADGATGWSTPRFEEALWEPVCMASLLALPKPAGALLFACPRMLKLDASGHEVPASGAPRRNLSLQLSLDEGRTWTAGKTLEVGGSGYSDLAVLPDGTLLCFYERDKRLTVARFPFTWLSP